MGEFVIPDLLGGPDTLMIGKVIWAEFFDNRDWPVASAVAVAILILLGVQLILAFIGYDIANVPTRPIHPLLRDASVGADGAPPAG